MAPALSEAGRDTYHSHSQREGELAMDGPAEHFLKDAQEMEQILGELGGADILRVIENMEGVDFLEPPAGERVALAQARLERRCQFLRRRLRMQQARAMGKHAAEEARGVLRAAGGGGALTRRAARALAQRLRLGAGRVPPPPPWLAPPALAAAAAALRSQLGLVAAQLDSDATLSSSGAESADEAVLYNNAHQQTMPLRKRALWRWTGERAWIASRWGWLQAQVQELEHRIRQHAELLRQVRAAKGPPHGYSGPLPGAARTRPLRPAPRRRKLLQLHNLHTAAAKAARPSDIRCICQWPLGGCAVCTGRSMPMHPLPANSTLSRRERIALVDPAFHTVLSTDRDVSSSIHYSAIMKDPQWQQKSSRGTVKSIRGLSAKMLPINSIKGNHSMPKILHHKKRKYNRLRRVRGAPGGGARRGSLQEDEPPSGGSSPQPDSHDHHRYRIRERERTRLNSSYDIDNIVIPHSIAANTKLEILQYKEILTPKWRVIEEEPAPNNGLVRKLSHVPGDDESDTEDVSEAGVLERHERCEAQERGKYLKKRKHSRRQNSRTTPTQTPPHTPHTPHTPLAVDETSMSSETSAPPPSGGAPPSPPTTAQPTTTACSVLVTPLPADAAPPITIKRRITEDSQEVIPPYSPRAFPLQEEVYNKMLGAMPDNHPLSGAEVGALLPALQLEPPSDTEDEDSLAAPDEDPTDPEWNVMAHVDKLHHR